jgi:hypothetical protein
MKATDRLVTTGGLIRGASFRSAPSSAIISQRVVSATARLAGFAH